jgi:hypothetical protein
MRFNRTKYILDDHGNPKPCDNLIRWGEWFGTHKRIVKQEKVGGSEVSTVFLGLDHNFSDEGPPVVWETMVFGGELDQEMDRCSGNKEQAEAMHVRMVERVQAVEALAE